MQSHKQFTLLGVNQKQYRQTLSLFWSTGNTHLNPGLGSPLDIISTYYKTRQGSPVGSRPFPMGLYPIYDTPLDIAVTLNQSRNIFLYFLKIHDVIIQCSMFFPLFYLVLALTV